MFTYFSSLMYFVYLTQYTKTYFHEFDLTHQTDIRSNNRLNVLMNVVLRSVRVTTASVQNNKHYICSAMKGAWPFYTVTCGLSGSAIFFSHYLLNGTI
jgi:hypothetical protein